MVKSDIAEVLLVLCSVGLEDLAVRSDDVLVRGQVFFKEVDGLQIGADGVAGIDWRCWILHHWHSSSLAQLTVLGFGGVDLLAVICSTVC